MGHPDCCVRETSTKSDWAVPPVQRAQHAKGVGISFASMSGVAAFVGMCVSTSVPDDEGDT